LYINEDTVSPSTRSGRGAECLRRSRAAVLRRMVNRDAEALRPVSADEVVYQNAGMPAAEGIAATLAALAFQFEMFPESYEYETINTVSEGDVVMNERLDCIRGPDGNRHGLPVMGSFVVKDGKIVRWTDYWDGALIAKMMSGEDYCSLVPRY
jgi:limonene-1,2-epoxide hydrolase